MTINFAPAEDCLADLLTRFGSLEGVTDVNCSNGGVALRRNGRSEPVKILVLDDEIAELGNLMASALDLELNQRRPVLEKRLPPKYRVTLSHPSITQSGRWNASIRILPTTTIPLARYVEDGCVDAGTAERLRELASTRNTMLISGATGAGKSTLLRSLLGEIPVHDRLVIIEQGAELNISRPNMVAMESTDDCSFEDLIAHSLRLDPDVIVVGEVRGREASRFITIAAAGHPACTTIHADGKQKSLIRLHRMIRLAEPNFDRAELEGAIDAVCHVRLDPDTGRRALELWEPQDT